MAIAQGEKLALVAGLGLQHASGHKLAEDHAAGGVGLQEIDRLGIAHAETVEKRGDGIAAKHPFLRDIAGRLLHRRHHLGHLEGFTHDGERHIGGGRSGGDAEGGHDGHGGHEKQQQPEQGLPGHAGAIRALR